MARIWYTIWADFFSNSNFLINKNSQGRKYFCDKSTFFCKFSFRMEFKQKFESSYFLKKDPHVLSFFMVFRYRISAYSFRRNYSFLKVAMLYFINWIVAAETIKGGKLLKGGNYSENTVSVLFESRHYSRKGLFWGYTVVKWTKFAQNAYLWMLLRSQIAFANV